MYVLRSAKKDSFSSLLTICINFWLNFDRVHILFAMAESEWPSGLLRHACGTDSLGFEPRTSTNACRHICRNVDQKVLAAMLTSIQSVGVAPEVNLRNSLNAGNKAHQWGIHPDLEIQGRHHHKSKTGVSVAPWKRTYPKISKKKFHLLWLPYFKYK